MSRLGRYWIFFVIVAVGLALSWGQVGRKAQQTLHETPVVYLATESGCRPRQGPCAAVASDRALVLGPDANGLRIRQTGLDLSTITGVEVVFLAADGGDFGGLVLPSSPTAWRITEIPEAAYGLRVHIRGNAETTAAEFSLGP